MVKAAPRVGPISSARGNVSGKSLSPAWVPHAASSNPSDAGRERQHQALGEQLTDHSSRLAPSAVRTANSLIRPVDRASIRLATLTQAISRTKPTAAISSNRKGPHIANHLFFQGNQLRSGAFVYIGKGHRQVLAYPRHIGVGLAQAYARLEPRNSADAQPAPRSVSAGFVHCPIGT